MTAPQSQVSQKYAYGAQHVNLTQLAVMCLIKMCGVRTLADEWPLGATWVVIPFGD